jgi:uncharacterized protein
VVSITHIFIYPIKGCKGISVPSWPLESTGLRHDRQWMIIDENNRFVSQREEPRLALCKVTAEKEGWSVRFGQEVEAMLIPCLWNGEEKLDVQIWSDTAEALIGQPEWDAYFSSRLNRPVRLVYFSPQGLRRVDPVYAPDPQYTFFSDGYPILLAGSSSLDYLNTQLEQPLDWDRFRPNIVVQTSQPHEEDRWANLEHNNYTLQLVKPCARCVVTTIDQKTGIQGKEPLATLAKYRKQNNKILFGMNTLVAKRKKDVEIRVNDTLGFRANAEF